jgi:putative spermidine/putrescine transport system ATP-binding protein
VRPERVAVAALSADEMGEGALPAALQDVIFLGDHLRLLLEVGRGGMLVAKRPPGSRVPRPGGPASVAWDPYAAFAFRALR